MLAGIAAALLATPLLDSAVSRASEYAADRYDYTEYYDDRPVGSLLLSTHRRGYNADEHGKRGAFISDRQQAACSGRMGCHH